MSITQPVFFSQFIFPSLPLEFLPMTYDASRIFIRIHAISFHGVQITMRDSRVLSQDQFYYYYYWELLP